MFDPKALSEYALSNMDVSTESIQTSLNLFQTFKRLYEQNPALLNEILNLATVDKQMPVHPGNFSYVLGLVTDKQALLITNVSEDRSQIFLQPQLHNQIWTFGRDPNKASLPIRDRRLSRCHAAIRYDSTCGFLLYDLASTNGTYVNGVRIRQNHILKDGDLIRLGSMNFGFFTGAEFRRVGEPPAEVLQLISESAVPPTAPMDDDNMPETIGDSQALPANLEPTLHFMNGAEFVQE
ncbi:MAG: FHA domain-containing protein [Cyanobacteria bacterium P01_D01_bin.6]